MRAAWIHLQYFIKIRIKSIYSILDITENQSHKRITRHGSGQVAGWDQDGIRINNQRGQAAENLKGQGSPESYTE